MWIIYGTLAGVGVALTKALRAPGRKARFIDLMVFDGTPEPGGDHFVLVQDVDASKDERAAAAKLKACYPGLEILKLAEAKEVDAAVKKLIAPHASKEPKPPKDPGKLPPTGEPKVTMNVDPADLKK